MLFNFYEPSSCGSDPAAASLVNATQAMSVRGEPKKKRAKTAPAPVVLDDLPNELIEQIATNLDHEDIGALAATSTRMARTVFREHGKAREVIEITKDLVDVLSFLVHSHVPQSQRYTKKLVINLRGFGHDITAAEHAERLDKMEAFLTNQEQTKSFRTLCDQLELCSPTARELLVAHQQKIKQHSPSSTVYDQQVNDDAFEVFLTMALKRMLNIDDIEMIVNSEIPAGQEDQLLHLPVRVANRAGLKLRKLGVHCDDVYHEDVDAMILRPAAFQGWNTATLQGLKSLDLSIGTSEDMMETDDADILVDFLKQLPKLETLKVTLIDGDEVDAAGAMVILKTMAERLHLPKLQDFTLAGEADVKAEDLQRFVVAHRATVKRLATIGVHFDGEHQAVSTMLKAVGEHCEQLEFVKFAPSLNNGPNSGDFYFINFLNANAGVSYWHPATDFDIHPMEWRRRFLSIQNALLIDQQKKSRTPEQMVKYVKAPRSEQSEELGMSVGELLKDAAKKIVFRKNKRIWKDFQSVELIEQMNAIPGTSDHPEATLVSSYATEGPVTLTNLGGETHYLLSGLFDQDGSGFDCDYNYNATVDDVAIAAARAAKIATGAEVVVDAIDPLDNFEEDAASSDEDGSESEAQISR